MEQFGGPAALGGVITGLMLASWMFGRWQSGLAPAAAAKAMPDAPALAQLGEAPENHRSAPAGEARSCQQAARDERRAALGDGAALGELHADMSALRRAEQILSVVPAADLSFDARTAGEPCRYLGISGHPTCPVPRGAAAHCACSSCAGGWPSAQVCVVQPSPDAPAFTRV